MAGEIGGLDAKRAGSGPENFALLDRQRFEGTAGACVEKGFAEKLAVGGVKSANAT